MDQRFATKLAKDARFKKIPKSQFKVEIDERFKNVFSKDNDKEKESISIDKRGRRIDSNQRELDMKKYYNYDGSDSESESDSNSESESDSKSDSKSDSESDSKIDSKLDFARGEGQIESSDEEIDDDDSDFFNELDKGNAQMDAQGPWADEDIPTGEETDRFACVNLDWDHVKAKDLFKVFDAFKPAFGTIKSVSIYPSEFGKEAMANEALHGPPTAVFKAATQEEESLSLLTASKKAKAKKAAKKAAAASKNTPVPASAENDDGKDFNMVALRKYQVDRLKYYYAVVHCDSTACARAIFNACDGAEFESSANFFDLRYIPHDMLFVDQEARDMCVEAPAVYSAAEFTTQALQHSNVKLTWDQDDAERQKTTRRKFTKQEIKDMDFKAYLASSSDEDEEDEVAAEKEEMLENDKKKKYRALLLGGVASAGSDEDEEEEGHDMEITFAPGLSEKAAKKMQEKREKEMQKDETVFEATLRKQREKKKAKKAALLEKTTTAEKDNQDDQSEDNADEFNDPFFQSVGADSDDDVDAFDNSDAQDSGDEIGITSFKGASSASSKRTVKNSKKKLTKEERLALKKEKAQLELLIMDDQSHAKAPNHFSAKDVIKAEKSLKSRKQKKKFAKTQLDTQDDFKMDLQDPRFKALLQDHQFFIDPTNPQFKETSTMKDILSQKRHARTAQHASSAKNLKKSAADKGDSGSKDSIESAALKSLVDSVKRKTLVKQKDKGKRAKLG